MTAAPGNPPVGDCGRGGFRHHLGGRRPGALDFQPLYDDSRYCWYAATNACAARLLAALREQDYIATTRDTSLRSMADETLQRMGLLREPAWEVART